MGYILAVALITWGGVFAYLVRLELLVRGLESLAKQEPGVPPIPQP